jgi:hypothetical protein
MGLKIQNCSQVWRCTSVILALRRLRQEDLGFEANSSQVSKPLSQKQNKKQNSLRV